jgi:hypothetical protein
MLCGDSRPFSMPFCSAVCWFPIRTLLHNNRKLNFKTDTGLNLHNLEIRCPIHHSSYWNGQCLTRFHLRNNSSYVSSPHNVNERQHLALRTLPPHIHAFSITLPSPLNIHRWPAKPNSYLYAVLATNLRSAKDVNMLRISEPTGVAFSRYSIHYCFLGLLQPGGLFEIRGLAFKRCY